MLVSQQVVDLATGSDLSFHHHGDHVLRGLGGWTVVVHAASVGSAHVQRRSTERHLAYLPPRELQVLGQLASGASNAVITTALYMSEATAKAHVAHLFVKLGCTNRVQLAILAHDAGV